jgi:crotonobetainyl-CoA:carnitine CoA-transferase CaiB-like acyl-CoA transferase
MATYFMSLNRSKRSITIDLKSDEGNEIMMNLIKNSDIFVQNFVPKAIQGLKLDYETV